MNDNSIEYAMIKGMNEILIARKLIAAIDVQALQEAFNHSEVERYEEFLLDEEVVVKADLLNVLEKYYQMPAVDVVGMLLDHDLVIKFPKDVMLRMGFVPYQQDGDILQVIAARPHDAELLAVIGESVSYDVVFMVGFYRDICDAVKEFYDSSIASFIGDDVEEEEEELDDEVIDEL